MDQIVDTTNKKYSASEMWSWVIWVSVFALSIGWMVGHSFALSHGQDADYWYNQNQQLQQSLTFYKNGIDCIAQLPQYTDPYEASGHKIYDVGSVLNCIVQLH